MPYSMDNMPEMMKGAPKHAMEVFIATFNSAFEKSKDDGAAMAIAMSAVHKAGYKKDDKGNWMSPDATSHMSPAGEGAGGGNHADSSPLIPLQRGTDNPLNPPLLRGTDWIPVFRTGTHTDSSGNTKTWTESDLDMIVTKYNPQEHEAPEVIGHPECNAPAFGWVEALKRDGQILFAKMKDRIPEFVDMLKKGLFKKRSISLYPDMTLRHVGWLGAMPPAIKGLANVAFRDDTQAIDISLDCKLCNKCPTCPPLEGVRGRNNFNNFCKEVKSMKWFEWMKKKATDEGVTLDDMPANFSTPQPPASGGQAVDIKTLVDAEVTKQVKAKELEFSEAQKKKEGEYTLREEALRKKEIEARKAEIASFCEGLQKDGKITPAQMKHGMGMQNFLESISPVTTTMEFSDGNTKKTQTPFEFMKSFLATFKKQIEFGEVAGSEKDIKQGNAGEKLSQLVKQKMEKNKDMNYTQAFNEVQRENIALASEYAQELTT